MPLTFFSPSDTLSLNTLLGLTEDAVWELQSNSPTTTQDRASGLDTNGDENKYKEHNKKEQRTLVYEFQAADGSLVIPAAGIVTDGGYHIDSIRVDWTPAGWPKLTVTCHKHMDGASHAAASCRTYSTAASLPGGFGVPAEVAGFTAVGAGVSLKSISYTLAVQHLDETGKDGNWFAGENRDGSETLDVQFLGIPSDNEFTVTSDWSTPSDSSPETNTASSGRTLNLVRHIKTN